MSLIKLDLHPPREKLRDFGAVSLCMLVILGLFFSWVLGWDSLWLRLLSLSGVILFILSRISPILIRPFYQVLILVGFPIGWLLSHFIAGLFYYLIICGTGLLFRILKRDALKRRFEPETKSYWIPYQSKKGLQRYFQQF